MGQRFIVHADAVIGNSTSSTYEPATRRLRAFTDGLEPRGHANVPPCGIASRAFTARIQDRELQLIGVRPHRAQARPGTP